MQIKFDDVTFFYNEKTEKQQLVLKNINFNLENVKSKYFLMPILLTFRI